MNLVPLLNASLAIQLHVAAVAVAAAGLVAIVLLAKGTNLHRWFGRSFVFGMTGAALTSFWIRELNHGSLSYIHIISVVTLWGLASGIWAARRGDVLSHRLSMTVTAVGGLGIAGAFAIFNPHRVMWQVFFG